MGVRLTVKTKSGSGADKAQVVLLDDEEINLGRDQSCQVVLAQMAVSRNHARITRDGPLFFIEDLGSSFGTHINGDRLPQGERRLLRNGDVIAIAQFDVTFDRVAEVAPDVEGKTPAFARRAIKDVMRGLGAHENAYLRVMNGPREGQHIELNEGQEYVFGRDEASADVVLQDDLVSRRHAKVRRDWAGVTLEDLQSRNGVKVNHQRITRTKLRDRDEISIGGVRLLFVDPSEAHEDPLVVTPARLEASASGPEVQPPPAAAMQRPEPSPPRPEAISPPLEPEPEPSRGPREEPEAPEEPSLEEGSRDEAEEVAEAEETKGQRFDLSSRQALIALVVGGTLVLLAVVLLILILAGA